MIYYLEKKCNRIQNIDKILYIRYIFLWGGGNMLHYDVGLYISLEHFMFVYCHTKMLIYVPVHFILIELLFKSIQIFIITNIQCHVVPTKCIRIIME